MSETDWTQAEVERLVPLVTLTLEVLRDEARLLMPGKGEEAARMVTALMLRCVRFAVADDQLARQKQSGGKP